MTKPIVTKDLYFSILLFYCFMIAFKYPAPDQQYMNLFQINILFFQL